jgi:hypothetical protein
MASGLQCPGCGHVHPAGLPEIARGDATFRCYGCYRTLSVPEGWMGHPPPRPPAPPSLTGDAPPGAGTRDARRARLAGRRSGRRGSGPDSPAGALAPERSWPAGGSVAGGVVSVSGRPAGGADAPTQMVPAAGAPLGWVASGRSGGPLPPAIRGLVWAVAFVLGFVVTAVGLKEAGLLGVNTAIDLYAGSGVHRFGVLLVMLPIWALLSAVIAHFTLEGLARRRRPRPVAPQSTAKTSTPT